MKHWNIIGVIFLDFVKYHTMRYLLRECIIRNYSFQIRIIIKIYDNCYIFRINDRYIYNFYPIIKIVIVEMMFYFE